MPVLCNLVTCCSSEAPATDCWCAANMNKGFGRLRTTTAACADLLCLPAAAGQEPVWW